MTHASSAAQGTPAHEPHAGASLHATPTYFGPGRRLFGWYHAPCGPVHTDCAVVMCAPLGYEEVCAHRALRHWADALAENGIPTLRFDYDGTGNSAGTDGDGDRVADWIASVEEAATELRARSAISTVVLVGVRMGGLLAMAAAERVRADALVLFATPASGRVYARELRAFGALMREPTDNGATDDAVRRADGDAADPALEVGGFTYTAGTLSAIASLDPLTRPLPVYRALVMPRDDVASDRTLADRLEVNGIDVQTETLPGYARMMVDTHQSVAPTAVIEESVLWLTSQYRAVSTRVTASRSAGRGVGGSVVGGPTLGTVRDTAVMFDPERALFGVLSEPLSRLADRRTGIVLANAGSVHGIGPGRLYVELARDWVALGFSVFRVDLGGLGDSATLPGSVDNHPYPDDAVRDLAAAVRWMREHANVERVVVAGLCSGAHATFHVGLELDDIDGLIIINPIVFYWKPSCALDVSAWMNYHEARRYTQSVRRLGPWLRLLRGQVDVRHVAGVAYGRARDVLAAAVERITRRFHGPDPNAADVTRDLDRIASGGIDVLLVFSEGDPGLDFLRRRHAGDIRRLQRSRDNFALRVIPRADHTFSRREARQRLAGVLTAHLVRADFDAAAMHR